MSVVLFSYCCGLVETWMAGEVGYVAQHYYIVLLRKNTTYDIACRKIEKTVKSSLVIYVDIPKIPMKVWNGMQD